MKKMFFIMLLMASGFIGCTEEEADDLKPVIDLTISGAFPINCSNVQRGAVINFKVAFSDNKELGSYSIDIHHNFDHHSHSTDVETCNLDAVKTPINPWVFIQNYTIPEGQTTFTATGTISIPDDIDTGDYHFMYKVTDQSGWQTLNGFSIKVVE